MSIRLWSVPMMTVMLTTLLLAAACNGPAQPTGNGVAPPAEDAAAQPGDPADDFTAAQPVLTPDAAAPGGDLLRDDPDFGLDPAFDAMTPGDDALEPLLELGDDLPALDEPTEFPAIDFESSARNGADDEATQPVAYRADGAQPYWPRFHGPEGNNKSPDTGLLRAWPEGGPPLAWEASGLGHGYSSVSIADGRIFTVGNRDGKTTITALDLDGNLLWRADGGPAWTRDYEGTRATPTIDGDRLYHQSPLGDLVCLNVADGELIWRRNSLETFRADNITWALAESVLVDGDRVITCPGGREASVAALNKMTGETVWRAESTGEQTSYATPTLVEQDGMRIILTMNAKALIGVNADTGKFLFRFPHETRYDINATKPIYHDGCVFISSGYGTTGSKKLRLIVDGETARVEELWHSRDLDNHHGGVILHEGYLYGASHNFNGGRWICLDWETGAMQWAERGVGKGSLTFADGMLYLLSERNLMGLAPVSPETLEVVSEFRVPEGGTGASWAHPVVIGGRLYVRHSDKLFVYDVRQ